MITLITENIINISAQLALIKPAVLDQQNIAEKICYLAREFEENFTITSPDTYKTDIEMFVAQQLGTFS